jgi:hypothetical protein
MDGQKKTSRVPAPQYIDFVMSWIQTLVNDEGTFPTKDGTLFFLLSWSLLSQHAHST